MAAKAKHRIVVDTNLWISFLLTSNYTKIDSLITNNRVAIISSQELINEFVSVAMRPKFKKYFSASDLEAILLSMRGKTEMILVSSRITICRDPKDNFLLSLAKDGRATHLLTGDNDLLILKKVGKTKIMTIADYFSRY